MIEHHTQAKRTVLRRLLRRPFDPSNAALMAKKKGERDGLQSHHYQC